MDIGDDKLPASEDDSDLSFFHLFFILNNVLLL